MKVINRIKEKFIFLKDYVGSNKLLFIILSLQLYTLYKVEALNEKIELLTGTIAGTFVQLLITGAMMANELADMIQKAINLLKGIPS